MIQAEKYWPSENKNFEDILNTTDVITFDWSRNISKDYILMSETFYMAATLIMDRIVDENIDNEKFDQWFFPAIYLYRQAIELLCKGLIIGSIDKKEITAKLKDSKHNIIDLFEEFYNDSVCVLEEHEYRWVVNYLNDLERLDKNSNLFRYPIKDGVLYDYEEDFLDIIDMGNAIDQCYCIVYKCVGEEYQMNKYADNIDLTIRSKVLHFASNGYGNCMLYESPWDEGYYRHIKGYANVAYFLIEKLEKNHLSFLTIAFLIRHAIELALKSILKSKTDVFVDIKTQRNKAKSHNLYKDLWKNEKEIIIHYAKQMGYDLTNIDIVDNYIKQLCELDKNGDRFRYPTSYGLEYHLKLHKVDYNQSLQWMIGIYNFLIGCTDMLCVAADYESEMKNEFF